MMMVSSHYTSCSTKSQSNVIVIDAPRIPTINCIGSPEPGMLAVPAAIVWLITLFRPNIVILKRRFAICYIVSGTVGILIGYGHFLIYVLKNQVAGIVCVHRGCFQSSKLLLIVAAYIIFGYILMIYFTFVLWARYKEFEIET